MLCGKKGGGWVTSIPRSPAVPGDGPLEAGLRWSSMQPCLAAFTSILMLQDLLKDSSLFDMFSIIENVFGGFALLKRIRTNPITISQLLPGGP